jgi:hypothetical protein
MKTRFLAFLAAVAVGSAAVLIYASQSREQHTNASLGAADDCSACEMSAAKPAPAVAAAVSAMDGCCASEAAKPEVATLDAAGCPYDPAAAGAKVMADVADVQPAKAAGDACCAAEATTPVVSAQAEQ